jgi:hypothetical protein
VLAQANPIYQQPEILSLDEWQEMVSPTLQVYMDCFIGAHKSVVQLCKEQMWQRRKKLPME